jgi:regulatory protein
MDLLILGKMQYYCSFQERTESEVRRKLASFNLSHEDEEVIVKQLHADKYFDNDRYTEIFVRSKLPRWGKYKIRLALLGKKIPEELIQKQLATINPEENRENIIKIATKWLKNNKKKDNITGRLCRYLYLRGYESGEISEAMTVLKTRNEEL